jgi:hypothetical protein
MKAILSLYLLLASCYGSIMFSYVVAISLKLNELLMVILCVVLVSLTFPITVLVLMDSSSDDLLPTITSFVQWVVIFYLLRTYKCQRIRGDIKIFLSDKNPNEVRHCPYNLSHDTLLSQATTKIWHQECIIRLDEILLLTDINSHL